MAQKPNVLVFGGLNRGVSSVLIQTLLPPPPAEPLVSHIRFVDKYSINPPTTYIPKDFLSLLKERKGQLEYRQANLTNRTVVTECFTPAADGRPFTHVFDCSGSYSLTDIHEIQVAHTFDVSLNLAREAAQRQVKAYVRTIPSFYGHHELHERYQESDAGGWVPLDVRGVWFHEAVRAIGSLPGLPLVVLRHGRRYGPGMVDSEFPTSIVIGRIYRETRQDLELHLPPKLRKNTIHLRDLAAAAWLSAQWIASMKRENANAIAGVEVPSSGHPEVVKVRDAIQSNTPNVVVPLFNVVDSGDTTQEVLSQEVAKVFGIQVSYSPETLTEDQYRGFIEGINSDNYTHWFEILSNSDPPVLNTPLTPFVTIRDFKEHGCALDGSKIRQDAQVLSFSPKYPRFGVETIKQYIAWCEAQGIWPK